MLLRNDMFHNFSPRLRFHSATPGVPGAAGEVTLPVVPPIPTPPVVPVVVDEDLGFPAKTSVADMTADEKAAYYKHHSRRHEAASKITPEELDRLRGASTELAALKAKNQTAEEKAIADALEQGKTLGSSAYLNEAVTARLEVLTGKSAEELAGALELIDVKKLTLPTGGLDQEKLTAYATTLGLKPGVPSVPPVDPVKAALERQRTDALNAGGGSIAAMQQQIIADINGKTQK